MSDAEVFLSKEDFRTQAQTLQGSRDFGAQLFCALLRSVAVEARLVCSLQPLPFSGAAQIAPKPEPEAIVISSDDPESMTDGEKSKGPTPIQRISRPTLQPSRAQSFPASTYSNPNKSVLTVQDPSGLNRLIQSSG